MNTQSIDRDIRLYFTGLKQIHEIMRDHNITRYKLNIILRTHEKENQYVQYFDIHSLVESQIEKERALKKLTQASGSDEYWEEQKHKFLNSKLVNKTKYYGSDRKR